MTTRRTGWRAGAGRGTAWLLACLFLAGCGDDEPRATPQEPGGVAHALLGGATEVRLDGKAADRLEAIGRALGEGVESAAGTGLAEVVVDHPQEGTLYPPDMAAPTILWHDASEQADTWQVRLEVKGDDGKPLTTLVPGPHPTPGPVDERAKAETNVLYVPTPYQASARSWTPTEEVWAEIKRRSREKDATLSIVGFASDDPKRPLSSGRVGFRTSKDPVGAPIFYRDVPLSPVEGEQGKISPLAGSRLPLIAWRLRDVGRRDSRLVLSGLETCTNCHSFSRDGKTLGMDIDGPVGDKGAYAIVPVSEHMVIDYDSVMSWNSFEGKPLGHKTIGFHSRMSPDGSHVVTTLNEELYVSNFKNFRFLQVFYPTRGILAWHKVGSGKIHALPGADDTDYVHCDPVWSPDGKTLVFARAAARDAYEEGKPLAAYPNDPNEPVIRYDLYRMPFAEGRGGTPVRVVGASQNGMSNTFPKISPDGRWIVYVKCKNGQLMRPDGRLWIVPFEGGEARQMNCNLEVMNSWHSFSPNGRWMVFSSKTNTPYTQMFLTHLDEDGNDSPAVLVPNATASNRAVNLPEFLNAPYDSLKSIQVPAAAHQALFRQGEEFMDDGQIEKAAAMFSEVLDRDPEHALTHMRMGLIVGQKGNLDAALKHYRAAVKLQPRNPLAHNNVGVVLKMQGKIEEAIQCFRTSLEIRPEEALANHNLGHALHGLGQIEEALHYYERAVKTRPDFIRARLDMAYAYYLHRDLDKSIHHYQEAVKRVPDDVRPRRDLARVLREAGKIKASLRHLGKVVEQDPNAIKAINVLAWELATHPTASVRDGARAIGLVGPICQQTGFRLPGLLDTLAAAHAERGEFRQAVQLASRGLEIAKKSGSKHAAGLAQRLAEYQAERPWRHPKLGGRDPWEGLE